MLLRTEKLTKAFGGLLAVNGIDFYIEAGTVAAIIGPNGSGKTTFFNVVSGILPATGGSIFFEENSCSKFAIQSKSCIFPNVTNQSRTINSGIWII